MIVAGIGCTARATLPEMRALLEQVVNGRALGAIACMDMRAVHVRPLADNLRVPLVTFPHAALGGVRTPTASVRILEEFGTGSVAEACALLAAGTGARILVERQVSGARQVTCALAARGER